MINFFLGITLPNDITREVEKWRREFKAPRTPAHITLIPPFNWEYNKSKLFNAIQTAVSGMKPFPIQSRGTNSFGRAVLFIDIICGTELLLLRDQIAQNLQQFGIKPETRMYHPHITLATRLKANQFIQYKDRLHDYAPVYRFICNQVSLFSLQTNEGYKQWHVVDKIFLEEF